MKRLLILCVSLLAMLPDAWASALTVLRYYPDAPTHLYRWQLLKLAMEHTRAEYGDYQLQGVSNNAISQSRSIAQLLEGQLEILSFPSSPERQQKLLIVPVDIMRGLLGYRILMIRAQQQPRLAALDPGQFRAQVTLGFNPQWADYPILQANGLQLVPQSNYALLFNMLAHGRFDAFPRGINEIDPELEKFRPQYPDLAAEHTLALYMPLPVYFWVNRNQPQLAERITLGLKRALADGSFKALFMHNYQPLIARIHREKRRVIYLQNPLLDPALPAVDTSWWLKKP